MSQWDIVSCCLEMSGECLSSSSNGIWVLLYIQRLLMSWLLLATRRLSVLAWKKSSDNGELFPAAGESRNIWKLCRFPSFIRRACHCPPRTFWHFPCNFNFNRSRPDIFLFSAPSNWSCQKKNIIICNNGTKTMIAANYRWAAPLCASTEELNLWDRLSSWAFNGFPAWGECYLVEKT